MTLYMELSVLQTLLVHQLKSVIEPDIENILNSKMPSLV